MKGNSELLTKSIYVHVFNCDITIKKIVAKCEIPKGK